MELGLSLGGDSSSISKPFLEKSASKLNTDHLSFHMGLSIYSKSTSDEEDDDIDIDIDVDDHSSQDAIQQKKTSTPLHLLPLVPLHQSDNGSSEGGSSARGFDVNRIATAEEATSSFRMDWAMYGGGGVNKRSMEEHGNDVVEGGERMSNSRASDDDENGLTRKKLRLSKEQSAFLEETFKEHNTLNPFWMKQKQKHGLAKQLNLRPRQVEVWFQNRRARTKLKQTEVDCEYLKRCCETLTEENRKLQKEVQELRALKSSTPFYMQSPATTLTMCPSCERVATSAPPSAAAAKPTTTTSTAPLSFPLSRSKFYPFSHTSTKAS